MMGYSEKSPASSRRESKWAARGRVGLLTVAAAVTVAATAAWAQSVKPEAARPAQPGPTLYVVAYSHLDTQWLWDYRRTIDEYLPDTMHGNFALLEKYPHYVFNFSGSNRYRMMKEYYPADYERVKQWVARGRWFPSGSSVEESDVNVPSAESLIRQILYGTQFFKREFGKTSAEYMLPDCFGFPASLPSILAHAGIRGFSTQKLTWKSGARVGGPDSPQQTPVGIPFNVGLWEGPDGKGVVAALNATQYSGHVLHDLSKSPDARLLPPKPDEGLARMVVDWPARVNATGAASGVYADFRYYGTGDRGGPPAEVSVKLMEAIVSKGRAVLPGPQYFAISDKERRKRPPLPEGQAVQLGDGPLRVVAATAEQMFLDLTPAQRERLPRYSGDLELSDHSAGSLTSQAYMKRWNRQNEVLADAAERAAVAAEWLGPRVYPRQRLNDAWTLVMGGQFHDILPGTSIPKAYEYSWNDEVLAMNQFADVLGSAVAAVAAGLDTRVEGIPLVVYNPLNIAREDPVEASVSFPGTPPKAVRVLGPDGKAVPAQLLAADRVLFLAKVPPVGFVVYDVRPAGQAAPSALDIGERRLENHRYRVSVDANGDVASIFDKSLRKELLAAPMRLALQRERPHNYPAWNMDWVDRRLPPRGHVVGPARIRIVETGPARVALAVERETDGSRFVQTIRLAAGDAGRRVEIANVIDWKTAESSLKATFPLTPSNSVATYNWGIGTVQRGNNDERQYEVASHQWFDLTDRSGRFGATVLSDCKYGSDKPADNMLRLTLLFTPGIGDGNASRHAAQATQDWGRHEFVYGLAGHRGDHRKEQTDWQGLRLNQPLVAFASAAHPGALGKSFSLLRVSDPRVRVLAVKKAEHTDEVVVRMVELDGRPAPRVTVSFAAPVAAAREINGVEDPAGPAVVKRGKLVADFGAFAVRSFAIKLAPPKLELARPRSVAVELPHNLVVTSHDGEKSTGGFDGEGRSLPAELLPDKLAYAGITFELAPATKGTANAVVARGQKIGLPAGKLGRLYVLGAAVGEDRKATFRIDDTPVEVAFQKWDGYIGQWDNRVWKLPPGETDPSKGKYVGLTPGFIKPAPVAWFASHRHSPTGGNEAYAYAYLFAHVLEVPGGAKTLTLPENDKIRILAITAEDEPTWARPAQALLDTLHR